MSSQKSTPSTTETHNFLGDFEEWRADCGTADGSSLLFKQSGRCPMAADEQLNNLLLNSTAAEQERSDPKSEEIRSPKVRKSESLKV